jgi:hypothetical protein
MPIPTQILDLEQAKFIDDSGNVCVRIVSTTTTNISSPITDDRTDNEYGKFVEDINGDTAIVLLAV